MSCSIDKGILKKCGAIGGLSLVLFFTYSTTVPALAATSSFQIQGVNVTATSPTDFGSARFLQSLKNLKADHANEVTFVIPLLQTSETSTDIGAHWNTPNDDALITAIQEAHTLGLSVTLKMHDEVRTGEWRAYIDPTNRTEWFTNYGNQLSHYAVIAQKYGVEQMVLGTELIDVASATHNPSNTQNWYDLIAKIRAVYSGALGYASNWGGAPYDEMNQIQFWDKLDFIGVDLYYAHAGGSETPEQMETEFAQWNANQLAPLQARYNKPVEFTEIGYRSVANANTQPFNWSTTGAVDLVDQSNAYQALFSYWSTVSYIKGLSLWQWNSDPNSGGVNDTDYTPQGKPAESIMSTWYGGNGKGTAISTAIQTLTASAVLSAISTVPNTAVTITTQVKNTGTTDMPNTLVDTEIYDQSGTKVFQQFSSPQTVLKGENNTYAYSWTPSKEGTYSVKVGVFSSDWSHVYTWNDAAASISVAKPVVAPVPTVPAPVTGVLAAVANSISATLGSLVDIVTNVTNGGSALSNTLIDIEVYDANGVRVSQTFTKDQSLPTGTQQQYHASFVPTIAGVYRIALGVFTKDWAQNLLWVNSAGTITATSAPSTTPPPAVATTIPPGAATTTPVVPPIASTTTVVPVPATSTPSTPPTATGTISGPSSVRTGTSINFGGNNFGHEENVSITVNGTVLSTTPHADGGGNFSTGSISVALPPGMYTYVFTGSVSGITGSATVTVLP